MILVGVIGAYLWISSRAATPTYSMSSTRDRLVQCKNANTTLSAQSTRPATGTALSNCTYAVQNLLNYYDQTRSGHAVTIDGWYGSITAEKVSSYKWYRMNVAGSKTVDSETYSNMISYMNDRISSATTYSAAVSGTKPSASNTGVPAGRTPTVPTTNTTKGISVASNGNVTITKGGVFENMLVKGRLIIKASNVTIRYSRVEANPSPWDLAREPLSTTDCRALGSQKMVDVVSFGSSYTGLVIEDSDLLAARPSVWIGNAINGSNYTLRRVDVSRSVDGVGIYRSGSTNVLVENSYIHDLYYGLYDYGHSCGPTHSDGIQVHYGSNTTIRNNTILGISNGGVKVNAAIQVNQNGGQLTSNLKIDGNWMDHGGCSVNVWDNNLGAIKGLAITNNKYGKGQRLSVSGEPCAMIVENTTKSLSGNSYSGNVWADGTTPAPTVRSAGT